MVKHRRGGRGIQGGNGKSITVWTQHLKNKGFPVARLGAPR